MKTRWLGLLVVVAALCMLAAGCKSFNAASVPSNQQTPIVLTPDTAKVLMNATDKHELALASALESNTENGSVIYADRNGYLLGPDGRPVMDKDGNPLKVSARVVAKLNSLQNFQNITGLKRATYTVGGYDHIKDMPDGLKNMLSDLTPCLLRLDVEGMDGTSVKSPTAELRAAAGEERKAILEAMAKLAESRGAAHAMKVEAWTNGLTKITVAAGREIVGRVLGTYYVESTVAGIGAVTEAVIQTKSGKNETVIATGAEAVALSEAADKDNAARPTIASAGKTVVSVSNRSVNANGTVTATFALVDGSSVTGIAIGPQPTSAADTFTWQVTTATGDIVSITTTSAQNAKILGTAQ